MDDKAIVLPEVGRVALRERRRLTGSIMGASVGREEDHCYLAVQVEVPDNIAHRRPGATRSPMSTWA